MKIDRTEFVGTFQTSLSTWEKCTMGASLDDTDDPIECYLRVRDLAISAHKAANPQLYKNGNEAIVESYGGEIFDSGKMWTNTSPTKTINREYEGVSVNGNDMASAIASCTDLKILESYKLIVKSRPELKSIYDEKYEELKK